VRPLGSCTRLLADGTLRNEAREAHVQPLWRPVLDAALHTTHVALGGRLLGVYLRGSLPRGLGIEGVSDVDLIVFALDDEEAEAEEAEEAAAPWGVDAVLAELAASSSAPLPPLGRAEEAIRTFQEGAAARFACCTKVEMRVVLVPPRSALGRALYEHLLYSCDRLDDCLPPVLPAHVPHAFLLATQAVTLWGVDVPRLLPAAAAVPPPPPLAAVQREVAAAREYAAGDVSRAPRVVRWGLRRYLRVLGQAALAERGEVRGFSPHEGNGPRCASI
jgi:hypothetical protein